MVDIDGVISLFGFPTAVARTPPPRGPLPLDRRHPPLPFAHRRRSPARARRAFELVWASGWEERADEHLPHLLGLPARPARSCSFERDVGRRASSTPAPTGSSRRSTPTPARAPLAWIDDALTDACHDWAADARRADPARAHRARARAHGGRGRAAPRLGLSALARMKRRAARRAGSPPQGDPSCRRSSLDGQLGDRSGISSSASSSAKPGSVPPAPIFSSEARSASNSWP